MIHRIRVICKNIATLGTLGYMPASGTVATLVTLPLIIAIKLLHLAPTTELALAAVVSGMALLIIAGAKRLLPFVADPRQIVLDEVVGCFWTFCVLPLTLKRLILGFLFFRFFDIVKPLGIRWCERLPGSLGIIADDIVAGNYALCLLLLLT